MHGRTRVWFALTLALSASLCQVRPARAQCVPVDHADPNQVPEITRTVLVNYEDDWDFTSLVAADYDEEMKRLFDDWTVQSFLPFSHQQVLWLRDARGLTVSGYLDEQLIEKPQMGARFLSSHSYEPQDFSVTLKFKDWQYPRSNTKRYIKLSVRNASDVRHRAFGIVFHTDYIDNFTGFSSQLSAVDISDDRVPSVFQFHGNVAQEGYVYCMTPGFNNVLMDPVNPEVEMTLTYHHGDPAQIEVALTVSGVPVIPGGCQFDLPEPLQTRFRFLMSVAHTEDEQYELGPGEEWVAETTLLQFETDLTYTGQGYKIDFDGLHEGGVVYNELYDQFLVDPLAPPAVPPAVVPMSGYYWGSQPLLSEHGVDFGRTMLTPSLGRSRFVEVSGHKPLNGLLVETTRDVGGVIVTGPSYDPVGAGPARADDPDLPAVLAVGGCDLRAGAVLAEPVRECGRE